jgi:hypothetical protein
MVKSLSLITKHFSYFHAVTAHAIRLNFQVKCTPRDKLKLRLLGQILDNTRVLGHHGDYSVYGGA